jgi:hypothetical protein
MILQEKVILSSEMFFFGGFKTFSLSSIRGANKKGSLPSAATHTYNNSRHYYILR